MVLAGSDCEVTEQVAFSVFYGEGSHPTGEMRTVMMQEFADLAHAVRREFTAWCSSWDATPNKNLSPEAASKILTSAANTVLERSYESWIEAVVFVFGDVPEVWGLTSSPIGDWEVAWRSQPRAIRAINQAALQTRRDGVGNDGVRPGPSESDGNVANPVRDDFIQILTPSSITPANAGLSMPAVPPCHLFMHGMDPYDHLAFNDDSIFELDPDDLNPPPVQPRRSSKKPSLASLTARTNELTMAQVKALSLRLLDEIKNEEDKQGAMILDYVRHLRHGASFALELRLWHEAHGAPLDEEVRTAFHKVIHTANSFTLSILSKLPVHAPQDPSPKP